MRYRERTGIITDIIKACAQPQNSTNIIHSARLTHAQWKEFGGIALEAGLIKRNADRTYSLTSKASEYLELQAKLRAILGVNKN